MKRVEVHDQIELVVREIRHPGVGVGVVGTGLVEDRERLAVARPVHRHSGRGEQRHRGQPK